MSDALRYERAVKKVGGLASSHRELLKHIKKGSKVLDVGCATGYFGEFLTSKLDCTVDGVEVDKEAASEAKKVLRRVYVGSIEDTGFVISLPGGYDYIVFADVLEHTVDPVRVLEAFKGKLKTGGVVLASIPNVAHWTVRFNLLRGKFDYTETGLLDRTHLRFFTTKTVGELFEDAGCSSEIVGFTLGFMPFGSLGAILQTQLVKISPGLFAQQFIIKARGK